MKKRFPSNIIQSILLLVIGLACTAPLFVFEKELILQFSKETYTTLFFSIFGVITFLVSMLINSRNGFSLSFNAHLIVNRSLSVIVLTIISYQIVIAPVINYLSIHFSTNQSTFISHDFIYYAGAILIGPIVEELIFRGAILNGMLDNYKNNRKALVLSALIFCLVHVKILQVIPAFFWGIVFGYFFYQTKSILLCIALHIIVNASGIASTIMYKKNQTATLANAYGEHSWAVYLISISVFILCLFYLLGKQQGLQKYMQLYYKPQQAMAQSKPMSLPVPNCNF